MSPVQEPSNYLDLDQWIQLEETGSTNDYLMSSSHPAGTIVTAGKQIAGKGRSGRSWRSAGQALFFSGSFGWKQPPGPLFSLAMGLAVLEALESYSALEPDDKKGLGLKWPNDVVRERVDASYEKLGGILIEGKARGSDWQTIVGIGLNWTSAPDPEAQDPLPPRKLIRGGKPGTSVLGDASETEKGAVAMHLKLKDFLPLLVKRLNHFAVYYQNPSFLEEYKSREILQQRTVKLSGEDSTARVQGIDHQGSLILDNGTVLSDSARNLELQTQS